MTVFTNAKPEVVGHRGAPNEAAENSPDAFAAAARAGATWVELDARLTVDGVVVVHHDPHTSTGAVVSEHTAAELFELGVWRLDTILDGLPAGLGVNVEIKNLPVDPGYHEDGRLARTVSDMISQRMDDRDFLTSSFNPFDVEEMAAAVPEVPVGQLYKHTTPHETAIELALARGAKVLCAPVQSLDQHAIESAHAAGLEVMAWTVNDLETAGTLAAWGVDAICTDEPAGLISHLAH